MMALCHLFVSVMVANILFILQSAKYSGDIFVPCLLIVRAGRGNILLTNNLYWYCSLSSRGQMTGLQDFSLSSRGQMTGLQDFWTSGLQTILPDFSPTSFFSSKCMLSMNRLMTSGLPVCLPSSSEILHVSL